MVGIVRWDPFKEMGDMVKQMNSTFNQLYSTSSGHHTAVPLADVFEEDGKVVVHMHIAGLTEKELDISADGNVLTVKGERVVKDEEKHKRKYMVRESSATIYRRMVLPKNVEVDKIAAHLSDGVLRLELPLKPEAAPKKIAIQAKKPRPTLTK
jgi:HSP20 family protein